MLKTLDQKKLYDTAYRLAILTVVCSSLEGIFSVYYGALSGSLTLFGNGIASFIAVISGFGIIAMTARIRRGSGEQTNSSEKTALRITGAGLYILTAGLVITGVINMIDNKHPDSTLSGIIIAIVTILVISILVWTKMGIGKKLRSKALIADAKSTRMCVSTSTMVLIASLIFEFTKFEYADSIGAIGLAYFAFKEARECFIFA